MINVIFTGNIFHSDGITPAQNVKYQGLFIKVNPNSSDTIWDIPRVSESNQYNFNLGDNSWLSQQGGNSQSFDRVVLCFWLDGSSDRIDEDLVEWSFIEWTLDDRDVYNQNIQLMGQSIPTCSFALSGSNPVHIIDTGSTDKSQWVFEGKDHFQQYQVDDIEIFPINRFPDTPITIDWGDTQSNTYPISGSPYTHTYNTPGDYQIDVILTNKGIVSCEEIFDHRVHNEVLNGLTWVSPITYGIPTTYYPEITGDLVSVQSVDYYIDGDLLYPNLSYGESFTHTFTSSGNHIIKQCIRYNDGFDVQIQCEDFLVEMETRASYMDSEYDCGLVFTDTSNIGAPPAVKYQWDVTDGLFILSHVEGPVYSDWYYNWPYKGTFQVRMSVTDSNGRESSVTKEYIVDQCINQGTGEGASGGGGGSSPWVYQETAYKRYDEPVPSIHIIQVSDSDDDPEREQKKVLILEIIETDLKV